MMDVDDDDDDDNDNDDDDFSEKTFFQPISSMFCWYMLAYDEMMCYDLHIYMC